MSDPGRGATEDLEPVGTPTGDSERDQTDGTGMVGTPASGDDGPLAATPPSDAATLDPLRDELVCQAPQGEATGEGWRFAATCAYAVSQEREHTELRLVLDAVAAEHGWTVRVQERVNNSSRSESRAATTWINDVQTEAHDRFGIVVEIIAPEAAEPGDSASVRIDSAVVLSDSDRREGPSARIAAEIPESAAMARSMAAASAATNEMSCIDPDPADVQPGATVVYNCSVTMVYDNQNANVNGWVEASIGSNWPISMTVDLTYEWGGTGAARVGPETDGTIRVSTQGKSPLQMQIEFRVEVPEGAPANGSIPVTIGAGCENSRFCSLVSYATTLEVSDTSCDAQDRMPVTAAITKGSLEPIAFSPQPQTSSGTLAVEFANEHACTGWSVEIQATPLTYTGPAPGQDAIVVNNLRIPDAAGGELVLSTSPQSLLTGGGAETSHDYRFALALDIPAHAAAGVYTSTFTVSTSMAP